MEKKLTFQCWNCTKTYKSPYEVTEQKLSVRCPYCKVEAVVDLRQYNKDGRIVVVLRGDDKDPILDGEQLLPAILPTQEPE